VFLGHSVTRTQNLSDETQKIVDEEIRKLVETGHKKARQILEDSIDELHILAKGLLEYETLSGKEIADLLIGKPPVREFTAKDDRETGRPASAVPAAGRGRTPPEPEPDTGGMAPQPLG
jgi:cell division protease FtsH